VSLQVELFRGDDYVRDGELALLPLLRAFFEPLIGEQLDDARFRLLFLPVDDPSVLPGPPSLVNLRSSYGYVQVRIVRGGRLIYQHPHPIGEIIGHQLQKILTLREPSETHWGFGIGGAAMDHVDLVRPAPEVEHGLAIRPDARRVRLFQLEEVAEPEPPAATLADLGADVPPGDTRALTGSPVSVVLLATVERAFMTSMAFSTQVEEGGFLAGRVFREASGSGGHIVEITAAINAERTGASMLNFTFTGESFLRVSERISTRNRGEQLLGWYHTHLFPASNALGLSSVDVDLHRSTFRRSWQVAALINITDDGRMLRFYRMDGETMALAPYWTAWS
jgi:hypothetical protein